MKSRTLLVLPAWILVKAYLFFKPEEQRYRRATLKTFSGYIPDEVAMLAGAVWINLVTIAALIFVLISR